MSALSLSRKRAMRERAASSQCENDAPDSKKRCNAAQYKDGEAPSNSQRTILANSQLNALTAATSTQRCGKVIRMTLTNFMCHSHLTIDFHSRVNFLVGSNGSGKSAVLAALVLGLGGNARTTNRSTNLKKLIKSGENSAKIEIVISNEGPEAFEAETYGNHITVIRAINQTSATYTMKNARGHVISRKAEDLHRFLMYHNVQVDNPVFVLNQDNAREFLKESDPEKNYRLFLKATQIDIITEKLNDCRLLYMEQSENIRSFSNKLKKVDQECKELKNRLTELQSLGKLKTDLRQKELERLWVLVTKHERELHDFQQKIGQIEEKRDALLRLLMQKDQDECTLKEAISEYESEINIKQLSYSKENCLYQDKNNKVRQMHQRCLDIKSSIDSHGKRIAMLEAEIKDLRTHIEERSKQSIGDVAEIRRHNQCKLSELLSLKEENAVLIDTAKNDLQIIHEDKSQIDKNLHYLQQKKFELKSNKDRLDSAIASIKATSKDKLSIFGDHVSYLLAELDKFFRAGKFTELPRGPIGRYIEVSHPKYRDIVEKQIGGRLHAYIVSSTKDRLTFETLLKQRFPQIKPTIITTKFVKQVYDVRKGCVMPPRGTCLLMDVIKCKDPVVMNCLIDQVHIETVLLTESKETAEHITANRENVPYNLQRVIELKNSIELYPDPNYRVYSIQVRPARIIQSSTEERINQLELEKQELLQRIHSLEKKFAEMKPQLHANIEHIKEGRALLVRHEAKRMEIQDQISELENFEYPDYNEIDILKRELSENENKLSDIAKKLIDKQDQLTDAITEKKQCEGHVNEQKSLMENIQREIETIKRQCDEARTKKLGLSDRFRRIQEKLDEINSSLQQIEQTKIQKMQLVNTSTKEALKKGTRIDSESTLDEIISVIERIQAKIKTRAHINDDPQKLEEEIKVKEQDLATTYATYNKTKEIIKKLDISLRKRFAFVKTLKQHMAMSLQFTFDTCLKMRQISGSVDVNHEQKRLLIKVEPRGNTGSNTKSSTKALSGGERSFSTVALLISLWSCVDHPFYCLDEYDVFTDEVNREYLTRMLIREGDEHPQRQYTFLTPQDMNLVPNHFIKIHSFGEPERR